jgi:RimJ/RimL family protein N-acetyltransferase
MTLELRPLSAEDMETVRHWRHESMETLRTPYMLTKEQQQDYYRNVICDRRGTTRYWGLHDLDIVTFREMLGDPEKGKVRTQFGNSLIGYGGIENIEWENRHGEISIIIAPEYRGKGYGAEGVQLFLQEAFDALNLHAVHGECYYSHDGPAFWKHLVEKYRGWGTDLPHRKFWKGAYWPCYWFIFYKENWP